MKSRLTDLPGYGFFEDAVGDSSKEFSQHQGENNWSYGHCSEKGKYDLKQFRKFTVYEKGKWRDKKSSI